MEVLRQKGWGCGLADRDVVAFSQVIESEGTNEGGKRSSPVVLMTLVHSPARLRLETKIL